LLGWVIGIAAHATSVFGIKGILGKEWEERKIKEIMEKDKKREKKEKELPKKDKALRQAQDKNKA
jgi:hypothetical protein